MKRIPSLRQGLFQFQQTVVSAVPAAAPLIDLQAL